MIILPAIDMKDGQVVRLYKGDFDTVHQVASDPVATARAFLDAGAQYIHMVDLDGARVGSEKTGRSSAGGGNRTADRTGRRDSVHGRSGGGV